MNTISQFIGDFIPCFRITTTKQFSICSFCKKSFLPKEPKEKDAAEKGLSFINIISRNLAKVNLK